MLDKITSPESTMPYTVDESTQLLALVKEMEGTVHICGPSFGVMLTADSNTFTALKSDPVARDYITVAIGKYVVASRLSEAFP
jgi:hypothetical protein